MNCGSRWPTKKVEVSEQYSTSKFVWLDLIRGLSAIAVCASHLRAAMFVDYSSLGLPNLLSKVFYAATGLGHQAVIVFFVLSGFFVGGSVLRAGEKFRPGSYAIARLSRLWIVLVPALVLTALIDLVIGVFAPGVLTGAFQHLWNSGPVSAEEYSASLLNFFANVFFLQTVVAPVFGTNGPLWSLSNEFWYYVLFPLLALAFGRVGPAGGGISRVMLRAALGAMALLLLVLLPSSITEAFPVWLLGLAVYFAAGNLSTFARRAALTIGLPGFAVMLGLSKLGYLRSIFGVSPDMMVGTAFCVLCIALAGATSLHDPRSSFVRISNRLSSFSYSLYLVHFPVVALIGATIYGSHRVEPSALAMLQFIGWMAVLVLVGIIFWWLFERNTDALRRWMTRRSLLSRPQRVRAAAQVSGNDEGSTR